MWRNPITQGNVRALLADPRYTMASPPAGELACGEVGEGRLAEVPRIVELAAERFAKGPLTGKTVLITAGPTREYFDPVRFLSNPSSGKMGIAIAQAARALGAKVTLVLGPVEACVEAGVETVKVVSAEEMAGAVLSRVDSADYFVAAAAVSDWRPKVRLTQKAKKEGQAESIALVRTPDVLAEASAKVHAASRRPVLVGFAAETEKVLEHAREKLERKRLDWIVANDVTAPGAGFAVETNRVLLIGKSGAPRPIEGSKLDVARALWNALLGDSP
jgi:phosphopantothenoylcysteine decarboxylase/phosphopantothenate--cysteine ligase